MFFIIKSQIGSSILVMLLFNIFKMSVLFSTIGLTPPETVVASTDPLANSPT